MRLTVCCYLIKNGRWLLLYRNKKKDDPNAAKWIGIGGGIEKGESPDEACMREFREETGLSPEGLTMRGVVTFSFDRWEDEYMFLYTAGDYTGEIRECDEGELRWVENEDVSALSLWDGDRIFLPLISKCDAPFFSLKLTYRGDELAEAYMNGKPIK